MRNYLALFFVGLLFVNACKKDDEVLAPEPSISLVSVSPLNVEQFKDSVEVTINYKDNNGDIGDESPDEYSLSVRDSRLSEADWYHVQPLAPLTEELVFEGQIKIKINTLFLLGNGSQELTTLTIKLKDRAGNWSNEVVSSAITINDTL